MAVKDFKIEECKVITESGEKVMSLKDGVSYWHQIVNKGGRAIVTAEVVLKRRQTVDSYIARLRKFVGDGEEAPCTVRTIEKDVVEITILESK